MKILSFLKKYLKDTTVHGFRYLVEASNIFERLMWIFIISTAFVLSSIIISSNLKDVRENPISVTTDSIPVQNVPFPAVTMNSAILEHPFRLIESIYSSNVKFDCIPWCKARCKCNQTLASVCASQTEKVRQDLLPLIKVMLEGEYIKKLEHCKYFINNAKNMSEARQYLLDNNVKESCSGNSSARAFRVLYPCLANKTIYSSGYSAFYKYAMYYTSELLAKTLWSPHCGLIDAYVELEDACGELPDDGQFDCEHFDFPENDNFCTAVGISDLLTLRAKHPFAAGIILKGARYEHRLKLIANLTMNLFDELMNSKVSGFPYKCLLANMFGNNLRDCVDDIDMDAILQNPDLLYKIGRLITPPSSRYASERKELIDAKSIRQVMQQDYKYTVNDDPAMNDYAAILTCKFGNERLSRKCDLFSNIFASTGIGYAFNNEPFQSLFRNTTSNYAFFKEFHEKREHTDDPPRVVASPGYSFSLEFVIRHDAYRYRYASGRYLMNNELFLSVHDPAEVPNLKSDGIIIKPGHFYEIRVHPTLITTDNSGLALDLISRNCLSREEVEGLNIFGIYTQSACIFECKLQKATVACNCSSWNYPRIEPSVKLCLRTKENQCFVNFMNTDILVEDCDCPNDCNRVVYDTDVHVTILPEGWASNKFVALNRAYNYRNHFNPSEYEASNPVHTSLSQVRVSIQTRRANKVVRSARVSFSGQLANLGGIIGLFTGMSILSLAESVYWIMKYMKHAILPK